MKSALKVFTGLPQKTVLILTHCVLKPVFANSLSIAQHYVNRRTLQLSKDFTNFEKCDNLVDGYLVEFLEDNTELEYPAYRSHQRNERVEQTFWLFNVSSFSISFTLSAIPYSGGTNTIRCLDGQHLLYSIKIRCYTQLQNWYVFNPS